MRPRATFLMTVTALLAATAAFAQQGALDGEWRSFGADLGSTKYSSLDQISADNVGQLEIAWRRPIVDPAYLEMDPNLRFSNVSTAAPLIVGDTGYVPNAVGLVEAFDVTTGETRWVQTPYGGADDVRGAGTRGVAYWSDGDEARIISQRGEYMYALDPDTGELFPDFGNGGRVHLVIGLAEGARYRWGAPRRWCGTWWWSASRWATRSRPWRESAATCGRSTCGPASCAGSSTPSRRPASSAPTPG